MRTFDLDQFGVMIEEIIREEQRMLVEKHTNVAIAVHLELEEITPTESNHLKASWEPYIGQAPTEEMPETHVRAEGAEEVERVYKRWIPGQPCGEVNRTVYALRHVGAPGMIVQAIRTGIWSVR